MIKLIVGLGNPGRQYERTRHNVGFLFLDQLVTEYRSAWSNEPKFQGLLAEISVTTEKVMLLKPSTFMNRSGLSVGQVVRYYKLQPEQVLVVHDELDFEVGIVKLKKDGGHAGHNGLRDIIAHLQSKDFYRLRIGIGRPASGKPVADYVLSDPSKADAEAIQIAFNISSDYIEQMVRGELSAVMNKLNS
jgi:PTH1 family peptidyl-tRNA hydrolase